jgi:hypothetical protein
MPWEWSSTVLASMHRRIFRGEKKPPHLRQIVYPVNMKPKKRIFGSPSEEIPELKKGERGVSAPRLQSLEIPPPIQ